MGIFALSTTVLSVFSILGKLGLDTALLRFVAEYSSQGRLDMVKGTYMKSMRLLIPFSLLLSVMLYLLSPFSGVYSPDDRKGKGISKYYSGSNRS